MTTPNQDATEPRTKNAAPSTAARKLRKVGKYSYCVTIPKEIVQSLGWRSRQKLVVGLKGDVSLTMPRPLPSLTTQWALVGERGQASCEAPSSSERSDRLGFRERGRERERSTKHEEPRTQHQAHRTSNAHMIRTTSFKLIKRM